MSSRSRGLIGERTLAGSGRGNDIAGRSWQFEPQRGVHAGERPALCDEREGLPFRTAALLFPRTPARYVDPYDFGHGFLSPKRSGRRLARPPFRPPHTSPAVANACGVLSGGGSLDAALFGAWGGLDRSLSALHPRPVIRAPGRFIAPSARFLDGILGCDRLLRLGDDGLAIRPHGTVPICHRAVGGRCHLSLPPSDLADRRLSRRGAPAHPVCRPAGIGRAAELAASALARPFRRPIDLFADRTGGDGAVAPEIGYPVRDVASHPHPACGRRCHGGNLAHGRLGFLSGRSMEARVVDRPDNLLDRAVALRAHCQTTVLASPAVPRRRGSAGTW